MPTHHEVVPSATVSTPRHWRRFGSPALLLAVLCGCSDPPEESAATRAAESGGAAVASGGSALGGASAVGGAGSGGTASGGTVAGTGGGLGALGGMATGGAASGGDAAGGAAVGGASTGGATSGGATTGGAASGGNAPGGATTGGGAAAGAPAGGMDAGGAAVGGAAAGAPAGGSATGGGVPGGAGGDGTGGTPGVVGPCDIYESGDTPCVAAHSTVRALYGAYGGNLYQVRRTSDGGTRDIPVLVTGGVADASLQDDFCAGTSCTISVLYDQSPNGNHLTVTPPGGWLDSGGTEADATAAPITVDGHRVYGVYTTGSFDAAVGGVGYRNNDTTGVAVGDEPEAMYMVASGTHYNEWCCFDYGNAETNNLDNGDGTMEAVYFGDSTQWGRGSGTGPWVMADLENGVFGGQTFDAPASNTSILADFVTAMLKGRAGGFALKGGDAQSGPLKTLYDGGRPTTGNYDPMRKEGAIVLGVGGDNSHTGEGTFFEGCMTAGYPSDAVDDEIQANIVAAGYGR